MELQAQLYQSLDEITQLVSGTRVNSLLYDAWANPYIRNDWTSFDFIRPDGSHQVVHRSVTGVLYRLRIQQLAQFMHKDEPKNKTSCYK